MNETELLFTELLGCDRLALYLNRNLPVDKRVSFAAAEVLKQRISGIPFAYITGKTEFMGMEFSVDSRVLIPRQDTEVLVETVLVCMKDRKLCPGGARFLDVGTGSGNIAVSLACFLPGISVVATDISGEALSVAKKNALAHNVDSRILFIQTDAVHMPVLKEGRFDCIISNPPYIPTSDIAALDPEVLREPRLALDGGTDGLDFYRAIISGAASLLKHNGFLFFEIGYGQKESVVSLCEESGFLKFERGVKDYSGIDRVIVAKKILYNG